MNCLQTRDFPRGRMFCIRPGLLFLLLLTVISFQASASGLWVHPSDGFGANFPEPPTKREAAAYQESGYAYQGSKVFENGGALYSITVVTLPPKISRANINRFLEELNSGFIETMGQTSRKAKVKWAKFGDGRNRLSYEFDFEHDGIPVRGHGFWVADKNRVIRVSVSYTKSLNDHEVREALSFLDSFVLLTHRTP